MVIIVMGVSASGKSEVSEILAKRIGGEYLDADDYHSEANKTKMHNRIPLTDEDRAPWLDTLRQIILERMERPEHTVLACSALKAVYRYQLRPDQARVRLVYLDNSPDAIYKHMQERKHFFRGLDLLIDQFCELEKPRPFEAAVTVNTAEGWEAAAQSAQTQLGL